MALTLNGSTNTIAGLAVGGLPDGIVDTDMLAATVNTIREADEWVVTADFASDDTVVDSNWARPSYTQGAAGYIGTGMSQSSGIFTFPSTGIWKIEFNSWFHDSAINNWTQGAIQATADDSTYANIANSRQGNYRDSGNHEGAVSAIALFDVTNTSTHKVRFQVKAEGSVTWNGHSTRMDTGAIFTRLGAT